VWKVVLDQKVKRELREALEKGWLSKEDLQIIKAWVAFVEDNGVKALQYDYKWDDHPLWGQWEGCRASCISNSGRIIYRVENQEVIVVILRITADHNYR
jgi:addiction module RelE/StbE family toxin